MQMKAVRAQSAGNADYFSDMLRHPSRTLNAAASDKYTTELKADFCLSVAAENSFPSPPVQ